MELFVRFRVLAFRWVTTCLISQNFVPTECPGPGATVFLRVAKIFPAISDPFTESGDDVFVGRRKICGPFDSLASRPTHSVIHFD